MMEVSRQEIKYILPVEKLSVLQSKLDGIMERDRYGNGGQ